LRFFRRFFGAAATATLRRFFRRFFGAAATDLRLFLPLRRFFALARFFATAAAAAPYSFRRFFFAIFDLPLRRRRGLD
jgi:hypothetical protein